MSEITQADSETRRDLLTEQFELIENEASAEPAPAPAKAEAVEEAPAAETKPSARVRDESGKFVSKNAQPAEEPAVEEVEEPPVWKRPPASWKKDYHEAWSSADPRLQEYAWQREEQMKAGVQPLLEKAKFADQIQEVVQPYMQTIQGLGIDAPQAVKALMEADHALRYSDPNQKRALFARLAQQYGVDLSGVTEIQQQQMPADPNVSALQHELNRIRGEVMSWREQQEQEKNAQLLTEINHFSQKAEHFEAARPTIVQLLQSGVAQTLDDAYEKAIRLDPELFESVQASTQAKLDAQKRAVADKAAKTARAAAVSVRSSAPGAPTAAKAQDRRTLLAEQFDGITSRL